MELQKIDIAKTAYDHELLRNQVGTTNKNLSAAELALNQSEQANSNLEVSRDRWRATAFAFMFTTAALALVIVYWWFKTHPL